MKALATIFCFIACSFFIAANAQNKTAGTTTTKAIHKYVIERDIPGAGKLSLAELQGIAQKSCNTIDKMTARVQWVQSYVTDDKVFCIYLAENEEAVREHAKLAGFPVNKISEVKNIIDPVSSR